MMGIHGRAKTFRVSPKCDLSPARWMRGSGHTQPLPRRAPRSSCRCSGQWRLPSPPSWPWQVRGRGSALLYLVSIRKTKASPVCLYNKQVSSLLAWNQYGQLLISNIAKRSRLTLPSEHFSIFELQKSVFQRMFCSLKTPIDAHWSSEMRKYSVK